MKTKVTVNNLQIGKIIKINKDFFTILLEDKSIKDYKTRGKLRNDNIKLVVGDNVEVDVKKQTIEKLLPRKNKLIRPLISNIDKLIIICSCVTPNFSSYLLDKFLVLSHLNNIKPIIVISKYDKLNLKEKINLKKFLKYYKDLGYKIYINKDIRRIKKEFDNSTVALTGQTGAGKSTLLNKIDKTLNLKTDEISMSLGRGKHTTRIVQLHIVGNGLIADTPGFSSLELNFDKKSIKNGFIEFKDNCKFKGCAHYKEDGCKVKKLVLNKKIMKSRYDNYIKIMSEVK